MAADITTPSAFYDKLLPGWNIIEALDSTSSMRAANKTYLPQSPNEADDMYQNRLNRAVLTPYLRKTVTNYVGRIFAEPVILGEDVPAKIVEWSENIDLHGNNITVFFKSAASQSIKKGSAWVLVDYPRVVDAKTLADERDIGARPYLTFYPAESVFFAKINDRGKLAEVRLSETVTEPDGEFGETQIEQIRRLFLSGSGVVYQIWRKQDSNINKESAWIIYDQGTMSIDEIPVVPIFTNRQDLPLVSPPPLLDLAYLCIKHWQDQSAQDNVAEVARYPMLAANGWKAEEDADIAVGPRFMLATNDPQGKFYYVEHSGAAIAAGRAELERLENHIALEGVRPLIRQVSNSNTTATQINSEDSTTKSEIEFWKESIKDAIETCLLLMAKWHGLGEDGGGSVTLTGDFDFALSDAAALAILQQMRSSGDLSRYTLWEEMKRRGIISDSFDPEVEAERIESEGPRLDEMSMFGEPPLKQKPKEEEPAKKEVK